MIHRVAKELIHILIIFNPSHLHPASLEGLAVVKNVIRALKRWMCGAVLVLAGTVNFLHSRLYGFGFVMGTVDNAGMF